MALAPPKKPVVSSVQVAGTMHEPSRSTYDLNHNMLVPGMRLHLQLDPENRHDSFAIKVTTPTGRQIGWVPRMLSQQVTQDIKKNGAMYAAITRHEYIRDRPYDCRLIVDLWRVDGADSAPRHIVKEMYACDEVPKPALRNILKVGASFGMHTSPSRTSVTLEGRGARNLVWFRKKALPDGLRYEGMNAFVLQEQPLIVELCPLGQSPIDNPYRAAPPPPPGAYPAPSLSGRDGIANITGVTGYINGGMLAAGTVSTPLAKVFEQEIPAPTLGAFDATTQTFTKETTMSKFDSIIASNKSAAQTGAIMEAGRIANNQVAKLAAKQLPMMVRGYADTAIGKVVIANLAAQGAKYFRPEDTRLAALTDAMMVQAFQVLMQTVDIEGFVDELLDSKDIKRAMSKLSDDGEEVAPAGRTRRTVAEK